MARKSWGGFDKEFDGAYTRPHMTASRFYYAYLYTTHTGRSRACMRD